MILLNSKSILNCDELEEEVHNNEIQEIIDEVLKYRDYQCALICKYQDEGHKDIEQRIDSCYISELLEYLGTRDIKNGMDVYTDGQYLIFLVYGQGYTIVNNRQYHLVTEAVKIMPFIEKDFYNIINVLNGRKAEKIF